MHRSAFSLVELSIVLVILGLLTGGILAGQSLIRGAELRSVSADIQRYMAASHTFRDKYFALPGDMTNAEKFWGTMATGTCPNATGGTGTQTCNGDGNGQLWAATAASTTGESFTFWQHLANAGLVEGSYTGRAGPGTATPGRDSVIGTNAPRGRISNAGFSVEYNVGGSYGIGNTNFMYVGGVDPGGSPTWGNFIKAEEAWNIDTKTDDGKPGYGKVITSHSAVGTCVTSATASAAQYKLDDTGISCHLYIVNFL